VTVPILEDVFDLGVAEIRTLFESSGLTLAQWDKARTDRVTVGDTRAQTILDGESGALRLALADEDEAVA
jgi:hypothetical protein